MAELRRMMMSRLQPNFRNFRQKGF